MTPRLRLLAPLSFAVAAALTLALVAFAPPATASSAVAPAAKRLTFSLTLDSITRTEQTMGPVQYGVNVLQGTTTIGGARVQVQRISVIDYVDGSGPISGFLTLTWPDGDRLGLSVTGQSELTGTKTHVYGTLRVIAGSGRWKGAGGIGVMEGLRKGPQGSPVTYEFVLRVTR